jgi:spermidine synthase
MGKMLLPLVGGSPTGWILAMAFFQTSLLAGYAISYGLSRFNPWIHSVVLFLIYCLGMTYLPIAIKIDDLHGMMSWSVFKAFFSAVFVPYILLTSMTSGIQRVFTQTNHPQAHDPYFLFAASNFGSFIGLLSYPLFFEFYTGLTLQNYLWTFLYILSGLLLVISTVLAWFNRCKDQPDIIQTESDSSKPSFKTSIYWFILSFVPCSLSMGVTTLITNDIGGIPLFWVIPLALYLLTFILAFKNTSIKKTERLLEKHTQSVGFLLIITAFGLGFRPTGDLLTFILITFLILEVFFIISLSCHTRLAQNRPSYHHLGFYYFMIALGGATAGLIHGFILPVALDDIIEFPIVVLLSLLLLPHFYKPVLNPKFAKWHRYFLPCVVITFILAIILFFMKQYNFDTIYFIPACAVFTFFFLIIMNQPRSVFIVGLVIIGLSLSTRYHDDIVKRTRNFFGAYTVIDQQIGPYKVRQLSHGNTSHGTVIFNTTDEIKYNTSYYSRKGPVGNVFNLFNPQTVGAIGLGVGQISCINDKIKIDYFEIDPEVVLIAKEFFPYLNECPARNIYVGDGRIELNKTNTKYDILLLDAFTSDSVPLHIITEEALMSYQKHLNKDGVMLFHVSNRYFNLANKLAKIASEHHLYTYETLHIPDTEKHPFALISRWVAIPTSKYGNKKMQQLGWTKAKISDILWTDDRNSLLSAIDFKQQLDMLLLGVEIQNKTKKD